MNLNRKTKYFLLYLNLFLICSLINGFNSRLYTTSNSEFLIPETNAGEISISTPENKTYVKPMSGYYPATYGFESDAIGGDALDWDDSASDSNCGSQVIAEKNGHYNVLEVYDNNGGAKARLNNYFTDQAYGTTEFWFCPGDATDGGMVRLMDTDLVENRVSIRLINEHWYSYDGVVDTLIPNVLGSQDNVWQHLRIHFESTSGGYQGLSQYTYEVIIDGISSGSIPFRDNGTSIDTFNIFTGDAATTTRWIDAVGYSWDPSYTVGDNLNEGLLLSYGMQFSPDWQGYSLDGLANKTIVGNTTIPFPNNGVHNIQVFGNDSVGEEFHSNKVYFSIYPIYIFTPTNKTYSQSMSGYYPATYGFESDAIGGDALDWDDSASDSNCGSQVIAEKNGHYNVLEVYDNNGGAKARLNNYFTDQAYGTTEFWFCPGDATDGGMVRLMDTDLVENRVSIRLINEHWYSYDGVVDTLIPNVLGSQDNVWQHLRIHFESTSGGYQGLSQYTYEVIIDGISSGSIPFRDNGTSIDTFNIFTGDAATTTRWIDAVGYSWDPSYTVGDNLNEGLLLSFETIINPDWLGYSLDGASNKTIFGNTTIPFPSEGVHTIQILWNFSMGITYQSEIRYFTTLYYPEVFIISPNYNEFFGMVAPNFEISITESNLHSTWYNLNGGINITFNLLSGMVNQTEWDKLTNGSVTIQFFANDTWGLEGFAEITIWKDTYAPISLIEFTPHSGIDIVNESTDFTLTADDGLGSGVSLIQYKINDSSWITYSTPFTLASYLYGDILISYQAIDSVGNTEIIQTLLVERTDTIAPISSIDFTPYSGTNEVLKSTLFTLTADDGLGSGISLIRYKIDDSTWFDYIGPFTLSSYKYGGHTITYQAVDNEGNIEAEHVIMVEIVSKASEPQIPGYHLLTILSIIGIVSSILIKNKSKI
ncbi:MAG: OmpL47-type beta-barrel domain-containing protein [Promethearchaeota archaeon]